jgi:hypothetical protein
LVGVNGGVDKPVPLDGTPSKPASTHQFVMMLSGSLVVIVGGQSAPAALVYVIVTTSVPVVMRLAADKATEEPKQKLVVALVFTSATDPGEQFVVIELV